jgi:hypothetical protein
LGSTGFYKVLQGSTRFEDCRTQENPGEPSRT